MNEIFRSGKNRNRPKSDSDNSAEIFFFETKNFFIPEPFQSGKLRNPLRARDDVSLFLTASRWLNFQSRLDTFLKTRYRPLDIKR